MRLGFGSFGSFAAGCWTLKAGVVKIAARRVDWNCITQNRSSMEARPVPKVMPGYFAGLAIFRIIGNPRPLNHWPGMFSLQGSLNSSNFLTLVLDIDPGKDYIEA